MGVFDFPRDAGERLVNVDPGAGPLNDGDVANALRQRVLRLGLKVTGLDITFSRHTAYISGDAPDQAEREKLVLAIGNCAGVATVHDNLSVARPEPASRLYVVEPGDTLASIAESMYGDASQAPAVLEANRPMLSDLAQLYPGLVLRIP